MGKVRESNFELLRCILMIMVISLHYNLDLMGNAFGYVVPGTINYYFVYIVECMSIIATNVFIILGGYFGWKSADRMTLRKPIGLLIHLSAYNALFHVFVCLYLGYPITVHDLVLSLLPKNWFVTMYATLMILSPFVNRVIEKLDRKLLDKLLILCGVLFSIIPTILDIAGERFFVNTMGLYPVAGNSSLSGYSIINFAMLYMIGAALSKYNLFQHKMIWDIVAYVVFTALIYFQRMNLGANAWSYANPALILSSIAFFNIFRKMHFTSKIINTLAKSTFGVLLIHMQYGVYIYLWQYLNIPAAASGPFVGLVINMAICCLVTYFGCVFFDMFCRFITRPVSKLLDKVPFLNKQIVKFED